MELEIGTGRAKANAKMQLLPQCGAAAAAAQLRNCWKLLLNSFCLAVASMPFAINVSRFSKAQRCPPTVSKFAGWNLHVEVKSGGAVVRYHFCTFRLPQIAAVPAIVTNVISCCTFRAEPTRFACAYDAICIVNMTVYLLSTLLNGHLNCKSAVQQTPKILRHNEPLLSTDLNYQASGIA